MKQETQWFNVIEDLQARNARLKGWLAGAAIAAVMGWLCFGFLVWKF